MTRSSGYAKYTGIVLLAAASLFLLQACAGSARSGVSPAAQSVASQQAASAAPILLTVPAATVQRNAVEPAVTVAEPAPLPPWRLEGAKDGSLPAGAILPTDVFARRTGVHTAIAASHSLDPITPDARTATLRNDFPERQALQQVRSAPPLKVTLYASPTTRAYFAVLGVDYQNNLSVWQEFLTRHAIAYEVVTDSDVLRYHRPDGVLLLPSAVALDEAERAALADYRKRGGAVLSTWLTGVRGALGEWTGFELMSDTLNTDVLGDTSANEDDVYIVPYGDSPVSHHLDAGLRIWTARTPGWYPLRLQGVNSAAAIMDWSRSVRDGKTQSVITYNERVSANGKSSRAVVLGYPELTWWAADPVAMDAIAYDALSWLARRPAAYLGTWPAQHRSALLLAVDESSQWDDKEYRYADLANGLGGRATYFVLTQLAAELKPQLQTLQGRGHEIACMGDSFDGFAGQSKRVQQKRFKHMVNELADAGIDPACAGFHAPMESYDATTSALLGEQGYRYLIGDSGTSETRLPTLANSLLVLPRTQNGPDDVLGEGRDFRDFLAEFSLAERMGGLNVLRIPGASMMDDKHWTQFTAALKQRQGYMWVASGTEIADWWQARGRVRVSLDESVVPVLLTVEVSGEQALQQPFSVMLNLPYPDAAVRLLPDDTEHYLPPLVRRDVWRTDVELGQLTPGTHHWFVQFAPRAN